MTATTGCDHAQHTRRFQVEELGEMRNAQTSRGYEVSAKVLGWSYICTGCGLVLSTHGTYEGKHSERA